MYFYKRYFIDEIIAFNSGGNGDTIREVSGFYITIDEQAGIATLEVEGPKDSNPNVYSETGLVYSEEISLSGSGKFAARYEGGEPIHVGDTESLGDPT